MSMTNCRRVSSTVKACGGRAGLQRRAQREGGREGIKGSRPAAGARAFQLRLRPNYQFIPCVDSRRVSAGVGVSAGARGRVGVRADGRAGG